MTADVSRLLHHAVAAAILAPSTHNTQPWRFRIHADHLELRADAARTLGVIDPERRQQLASCGCALYNARLTLRAGGFDDEVEELPDHTEPDLLARLRPGIPIMPTARDLALAAAIPRRHTNRRPFLPRPVAQSVTDDLAGLALAQRAWMVRLDPDQKRALGQLVAEADRQQLADPKFRDELARWLAGPWSNRKDGIPFSEKEYGSSMPLGVLLRLRSPHLGEDFGAMEDARIQGSPVVAVLGTDGDEPMDWLDCGQALQAVLLAATDLGLGCAFLNQVLELPPLRDEVGRLVGRPHPHMIIRLGVAQAVETPAPRRDVDDVLE